MPDKKTFIHSAEYFGTYYAIITGHDNKRLTIFKQSSGRSPYKIVHQADAKKVYKLKLQIRRFKKGKVNTLFEKLD